MNSVSDIDWYEISFRENYRYLYLVAFQVVRDHDSARDIVQDFFLSVWQRRTEIAVVQSFRAYAVKAVRNLSLSWLDKYKKEATGIRLLQAIEQDAIYSERAPTMIEKENAEQRVMQVVDLLPEDRRKIFLAYVVDDLSYAEIAAKYQVSVNTVKTQMKRSYAFVRSQLSANGAGLVIISLLMAPAGF